jgi:hypothetical protein
MRGTVPALVALVCPLGHRSSAIGTAAQPRCEVVPGPAGIVQSVTAPRATRLPATLAWAVRLLFVEAAGLGLLTAYLIYLDLTDTLDSVLVAIALTVLAAFGAACVAFLGRALARLAKGARGPAIVVQLMVIATGGFLLQTGPLWLGLVLMALAVTVGLLIVLPPSTRALGLD